MMNSYLWNIRIGDIVVKSMPVWLIFFAFAEASSNTVYVGPEGDNSNPGTFNEPFAGISHAVSVIGPGDTIYVLGGTYILTSTIQIGSANSGTPGNLCHLFAYPGDTVLLDFYLQPFGERGIALRGDYWYIKGLNICNSGDNAIYITGAHNRIEQCTLYGNDDTGLQISGGGSYNIVINCDSYNNADPGNGNADGFAAKLNIGPGNEFHGCRAWNNSDDGWDLYEATDSVVISNCWTFRNGYLANESPGTGEGNGFKVGGNHVPGNHLLINCISFDNRRYGYHQNNNTGRVTIYNSLAWGNLNRNFNFYYATAGPNTLVNNVSFESGAADRFTNCILTTNSWQTSGADRNDYITLNTERAKDARLPDGSLPPNDFARLVPGSQLIDSGTDIGLPFTGTAPDLGPFEMISEEAVYTLTVQISGQGGVWLTPPGGAYENGQSVTLTAWHTDEYYFEGWEGELTGNERSEELIMDSDKEVTATFLPLYSPETDSFRIEAENMILSGYIFERMAGASNNKVVRPVSAAFGSARYVYQGEESYHKVVVRYIDFINGEAEYRFSVNDIETETWLGDVAVTANKFVDKTILNVMLCPDDILKIESKPGGQEYGRIDCMDIIKSGYIDPGLIFHRHAANNYSSLHVYPNPFSRVLKVELTLEMPDYITLELYNPEGKLISIIAKGYYNEGQNSIDFSSETLTPGVYFLRLMTNHGINMLRIIKY